MKKFVLLALMPVLAMAQSVSSVKFKSLLLGYYWTMDVEASINGSKVSFTVENGDFNESGSTEATDTYTFDVKDDADEHSLSGTIIRTNQPLIGNKYDVSLNINSHPVGSYVFGVVSHEVSGGPYGGTVTRKECWSWPCVESKSPSYAYGSVPSKPEPAFEPKSWQDCSKLIPNLWGATGISKDDLDAMLKPYRDCIAKFPGSPLNPNR